MEREKSQYLGSGWQIMFPKVCVCVFHKIITILNPLFLKYFPIPNY